jgi:cytochrome c oxidase accessory protein FixG
MKKPSFRTLRRIVAWLQAGVILTIPFIRVEGESALRFDVPSLKLYFFGSVIWIREAYFFLLIFLLFFAGVMLFTVLYGRIWCGWLCPQTVLSDFAGRIEKISTWFGSHRILGRAASQASLVLLSVLVAANLIWYFVSPYQMLSDISARSLGPWTMWSWSFMTVLIYLDLSFAREKLCGSACPYALSQEALYDERTLAISFDRSQAGECTECGACVRACPAGIDIRDGLQTECINCAECIDACNLISGTMNRKPLVGYTRVKGTGKGARLRVLGLAAAVAFVAVQLAYQIYTRVPLDFWVMRETQQTFQQAGKEGRMLNDYALIVENRSLDPELFHLSIGGIRDARLIIAHNPFMIPPNTALRMKFSVLAERKNLTYRVTPLRFVLENVNSLEIRIEQEAEFIYPMRTEQGLEI